MACVLRELISNDDGAAMVEYGIIAALIAIPSLLTLLAIANLCGGVLNTTGTGLTKIGATNP